MARTGIDYLIDRGFDFAQQQLANQRAQQNADRQFEAQQSQLEIANDFRQQQINLDRDIFNEQKNRQTITDNLELDQNLYDTTIGNATTYTDKINSLKSYIEDGEVSGFKTPRFKARIKSDLASTIKQQENAKTKFSYLKSFNIDAVNEEINSNIDVIGYTPSTTVPALLTLQDSRQEKLLENSFKGVEKFTDVFNKRIETLNYLGRKDLANLDPETNLYGDPRLNQIRKQIQMFEGRINSVLSDNPNVQAQRRDPASSYLGDGSNLRGSGKSFTDPIDLKSVTSSDQIEVGQFVVRKSDDGADEIFFKDDEGNFERFKIPTDDQNFVNLYGTGRTIDPQSVLEENLPATPTVQRTEGSAQFMPQTLTEIAPSVLTTEMQMDENRFPRPEGFNPFISDVFKTPSESDRPDATAIQRLSQTPQSLVDRGDFTSVTDIADLLRRAPRIQEQFGTGQGGVLTLGGSPKEQVQAVRTAEDNVDVLISDLKKNRRLISTQGGALERPTEEQYLEASELGNTNIQNVIRNAYEAYLDQGTTPRVKARLKKFLQKMKSTQQDPFFTGRKSLKTPFRITGGRNIFNQDTIDLLNEIQF
jgi:hypothetical protein